jgi:hypothetical protein
MAPSGRIAPSACEEPEDPARPWVSADYLLWRIKKGPLPIPLATAGSIADAVPGALGQPGTRVLLGNADLDYKTFSGGRLSAGFWVDPNQALGLEARGFLLQRRTLTQALGSDANGNPGIFRPLNDAALGQDSFTVSFPGMVSGNLAVASRSQLWGAEANACTSLYDGGGALNMTLLGGFRYLNLDERIDVSRFSTDFGGLLASPANPAPPFGLAELPGSTLAGVDSFHTRNQFYGGQLGVRAQYALSGGLLIDVRASVALGTTHQTIDIAGTTTQTQPGLAPASFPVGALAGASNGGHFGHDAFSVVPEAQVRLGYRLTDGLHLFAGYDFLYWSNVARPGEQISTSVDQRAIPSGTPFTPGFRAALPAAPSFHQSDFWAQGVSFGAELRY